MTTASSTVAVVFVVVLVMCGIVAVGASTVSADDSFENTTETPDTDDEGADEQSSDEQSSDDEDDGVVPMMVQLGDLTISEVEWADDHAIIRGEATTPTALTVTDAGASADMGENEFQRINQESYRLERGEEFEIRFSTDSGGDDAISISGNDELIMVTGDDWTPIATGQTPPNFAWLFGVLSGITGFVMAVIAHSARDASVEQFSGGGAL